MGLVWANNLKTSRAFGSSEHFSMYVFDLNWFAGKMYCFHENFLNWKNRRPSLSLVWLPTRRGIFCSSSCRYGSGIRKMHNVALKSEKFHYHFFSKSPFIWPFLPYELPSSFYTECVFMFKNMKICRRNRLNSKAFYTVKEQTVKCWSLVIFYFAIMKLWTCSQRASRF